MRTEHGLLTGPTAARHKSGFLAACLKNARLKVASCCYQANPVAEKVITDVSLPGDFSFGTMPAGFYILRVCAGAWFYGQGWAVSRLHTTANDPPGPNGFAIALKYQGPSGEVADGPNEPTFASGQYSTAAAAARAACGAFIVFEHCGGTMKLSFADNPYSDNYLGSAAPTYKLWQYPAPCFKLRTTYATRLGTNHYQVRFRFDEVCGGGSTNAVFTPAITGGNTVNPASITQSVTPWGWFDITFDWYGDPSGNTEPTVSLASASACGIDLGTTEVEFAPLLQTTAIQVLQSFSGGCTFEHWRVLVHVANVGNFPTDALTATITSVSGAVLIQEGSGCPDLSSQVEGLGSIAVGGTGSYYIKFRKTGNPTATFNIAYTDGPVTHPVAQITVAL